MHFSMPRTTLTGFFGLILAFALPQVAHADSCKTKSLQGGAAVYAMSSEGDVYACDVSIGKKGKVKGACDIDTGDIMLSDGIVKADSKLKVKKNCRVKGLITFESGCTLELTHGWLTRDKKAFEGVGRGTCDGDTFATVKLSAVAKPKKKGKDDGKGKGKHDDHDDDDDDDDDEYEDR